MNINKLRKHYSQLRPIYKALGMPDDVQMMQRLCKLERTLHRHAEEACSVPLSARQELYRERFAENAVKEVESMMPLLAGKVFINGDPRGWAIKIDDKHKQLINDSRIARDWGGYGLLSPDAQF
jgi:hypothetical protein